MKRLSPAETLSEAMDRRPALRPMFEAFAPLMELRSGLPAQLAESVAQSVFRLPDWDDAKAKAGTYMLAEADLSALALPLQEAAHAVLPVITGMQGMKGYGPVLRSFFFGEGAIRASRALIDGDSEALEALAVEAEMPLSVLVFALEHVLGSVIRAAVLCQWPSSPDSHYGPEDKPAPWDERPASWTQGYCPVCGSAPSVSYLEEKIFDEKNAFASGGGGRKHLHCGLCGTEWHFRRGACPACGKDEEGTLEMLRQAEEARGERVEWCTHCKSYCTGADLRERDTRPDMNVFALGLMHLDIAASERGLTPLYPAFWNQF
ncbi:MAG: formate dehydrogenase accessory protein FdhE [Mailhella sp.]|nr:formate dehydrogenase accessory protein FdhE [Mailhella sp.]